MKKTISILGIIILLALGYYHYQQSQKDKNTKEPVEQKDKEVIKVGAILPLTGKASFIGQSIKKGLLLSNDKNKDNIELIFEDSQGIPNKAISAYEKLKLTNKTKTFIPVFSSVTNAIIKKSKSKEEIFIATCVSSAKITQKSDRLFRLFVNADGDARLMAKFAYDSLKYNNIYIIHVNDDFGLDYSKAFSDEFKGQIIGKSAYGRGEKDFKNILNKVKNLSNDIDAIYLLGYDNNFISLLNQYILYKLNKPILSIATIAQPNVTKNLKLNDIEIYYTDTTLYEGDKSEIKNDFFERYKSKFGENPNYFAAFSYDLLNIINECNVEGNKLGECLKNKTFIGVMGKIKFDKTGDASFPMVIKKLKNNDI